MPSVLRGAHEALQYARNRKGDGYGWLPPTGEKITALRERLGLTQSEFAAKFGLDLGTLRNWEQNRRKPERPAALLLSIINEEPDTIERLLSKAKRRKREFA